jgi:uncharacterized protein YccT (UPF0319 family)
MSRRHILFSVERARIGFLAIVSLIVMTGCSSSMSRVQAWEGDVENADQAAVLSVAGGINVKEINGRSMTNFLIDDLNVDYALLPGENRVVFTYKSSWAKAEAVEDGESKVHVVETPRQVVTLNAEPNDVYRFDFAKPGNRRQAEAFVEDFSVDLINASGQTVATSSPWSASDSRQAVTRAPVPDSKASSAPLDASSATTLEQLKTLWGNASEEEKREFLRWAFE